jgi:hypothetical protein
MYCKYVAIVGLARAKGGVIEDKLFTALCVTELLVEGVELRPQLEHSLLLLRERELLPLAHVIHG